MKNKCIHLLPKLMEILIHQCKDTIRLDVALSGTVMGWEAGTQFQ